MTLKIQWLVIGLQKKIEFTIMTVQGIGLRGALKLKKNQCFVNGFRVSKPNVLI